MALLLFTTPKFQIFAQSLNNFKSSILLEEFTTEKCSNCPSAKPIIHDIYDTLSEKGYQVSIISHHAGFFTDFLTLTESKNLIPYFFDPNNVGCPSLSINRTFIKNDIICYPNKKTALEQLTHAKSYGEITSMSFHDGIITISGIIDRKLDLNQLYLHIVITESKIPCHLQLGAGGNFLHDDVARKFIYPIMGYKLQVNPQTGKFEVSSPKVTISPDWNVDNLEAVAFITKPLGKPNTDYRNRYVICSNHIAYDKNILFDKSSNANSQLSPKIKIFNGKLEFYPRSLHPTLINIFTLDGKLVASNTDVQLRPGIYLVKMRFNELSLTQKIIIKH